MKTFQIRSAIPADSRRVKELLAADKLPVEDISEDLPHFFVVEKDNKIIGAAGLEVYGEYGLLRSMVTDISFRNHGVAALLLTALFGHARTLGLKEMYLLTETAVNYFSKKGFNKINREDTPEVLKRSSEFTLMCPSTAAVMKKEISPKKKILFVCIENSNRSQMSQAFALMYGDDKVEAYSAGSRPTGIVNPKAIAAMKELGYDLRTHDSKPLKEVERFAPFDAVVTMGCGDACPWMPAKKFIDWQIPDPKHMEREDFNKVRDFISDKVKTLLEELE